MHSIIVLAAGQSDRWHGKPKHLLRVDGESLKDRIYRLFGDVLYITKHDIPNTTCTCDTLLQSSIHWKEDNIILLGDVRYTEYSRDVILTTRVDLSFFSDRKDIFAIRFGGPWINAVEKKLLIAINSKHNQGRLWELYRAILGLPKNVFVPHGNMLLTLIGDETQDFDEEEDLLNFSRGISKNNLYAGETIPTGATS